MELLERLVVALGSGTRVVLVLVALSIAGDFLFFGQHPTPAHPYSSSYAYTAWAILLVVSLPRGLLKKYPLVAAIYVSLVFVGIYAVAKFWAESGAAQHRADVLLAEVVICLFVIIAVEVSCLGLISLRRER